MKNIKNTLSLLFQNQKNKQFWKISLLKNWSQIIGNISSRVCIHKIYHDSITLGVYEACWMQELYILSPIIKTKINAFLGNQQIKTIRFRSISKKESGKTSKEQSEIEFLKKKLTAKEKLSIQQIKDPSLAKSLKTLLEKCHH